MQLAKKLAHVDSLEITMIECTKNDLGPLRPFVTGFPTIVLFPAGDRKNEAEQYIGDRSTDDMTKWLHAHVFHDFSDTPQNATEADAAHEPGILGTDDDL